MPAPSSRARLAAAAATTLSLVIGTALLASLSTAAGTPSAGSTRPAASTGSDPVIRYAGQRSIDGGTWAGVVVHRGSFSSVSANWIEPKVSCSHRKNVMAPWLGIDGWGSVTVQQTGVETSCSSGKPRYRAWYELYPDPPVYYHDTVRAGDKISASVTRHGNRYTLRLTDSTRHWTRTTVRHADAEHTSAEIALESPTGSYPRFGRIAFSGARMNTHTVTHYSLLRLDASSPRHEQNHTSPVSNGRFTISYEHE